VVPPPRRVYDYRDPLGTNGPCRTARVQNGRLSANCKAAVQPIDYLLDETQQGSIGLRLTSGPGTYCTVFGGTIAVDSGARGRFVARGAAPPVSCVVPPAPCP
jgi:hypothetical protein